MNLNDQAARMFAIDPEHSYVVSAPAGSGKTELLTQRILSLLARVKYPENILSITFTRKAANEMRQRVLKALHQAEQQTPISSKHQQVTRDLALGALAANQQHNWGLLQQPLRLRLQTIDSLCSWLSKQLCLETGAILPSRIRTNAEPLYTQAAERCLNLTESDNDALKQALATLLRHFDNDLNSISQLLANLLSSRDSWLPLVLSKSMTVEYLLERTNLLNQDHIDAVVDLLLPFASELEQALNYVTRNMREAKWLSAALPAELPESCSEQLEQWQAIRQLLLSGKAGQGTLRSQKGVNKSLGFPTESEHVDKAQAKSQKQSFQALLASLDKVEPLVNALDRLGTLPFTETIEQQKEINNALFQVLPVLAVCFNLICAEQGETDFTANTIAAIDALGPPENPTPLTLRLDYRIQHILIDEFQDTSQSQMTLVERLIAGWEQDDNRTLFAVGDGMQSIYNFRKAQVDLFIRTRNHGIAGKKLKALNLSANFRSKAPLVDWFNQTFSRIFPSQDDMLQSQVGFLKAQSVLNDVSDEAVSIRGFTEAEAEACAIATDIAQKIKQQPLASFAVLVRSRSHLQPLFKALREQDVTWHANEVEPLNQHMAVIDMHSLCRALHTPADRIAWVALLRSPWAGLNMADLLHCCEWQQGVHGDFIPIWIALQQAQQNPQISTAGKAICARLVMCFENALKQLGKKPLSHILETTWQALDAPASYIEETDSAAIANYLDLIAQQEQAGFIIDWLSFDIAFDKLYVRPDNSHAANEKPQLELMTIHKSKGLEFDHIYLPALERIGASNNKPLIRWWQRPYDDGSSGYLLAAKPEISAADKKDGLFEYLGTVESNREQQELKRLLYVATTRAKNSLWCSATLKQNKNAKTAEEHPVNMPSKGSLLNLLWPIYKADFCDGIIFQQSEQQQSIQPLNSIRRLAANRPMPKFKSHFAIDNSILTATNQVSDLPFNERFLAQQKGNMLHHSLMRIVQEHLLENDQEHLLSGSLFTKDWQIHCKTVGIGEGQQKVIFSQLEQMLNNIQTDDIGRWILNANHEQSAAELTVNYLSKEQGVQLAIIDRTFVEKGTRWIIDYKTSQPNKGQSNSDFLREQLVQYQPQLNFYSQLFDDVQIKTMLYFPACVLHVTGS